MSLESTQDLLYLTSAIAIPVVAIFLCWALYEIARVFHQANLVLTDTREKINRVEHALMSIKERFDSYAGYLSVLAEGGKSLMSFFHKKDEDEDDEQELVVRKRSRKK